ncbi:tetratricopeptide repeat protein [Stutzerimonas kirkiae]|uniref:Uncharacterized protein n=1 Tax=Stutzerimonas kirkiae TaxID=2211392 RepID=A0A4Q9R9I8_9GAMM|nr:tetratricopeptide repeat protein [Stutzerimonas kirkiae]TBU97356.1 hypothetical protein DNJ96_08640 [Stutzerimonas kirkiae]TBU98230.1 hypothetical protein DNJ95_18410 [Stutzerimonas kirkiae]TBV06616.1 hypothetical protein DNK08_14180 [Stutzerimonas kirkiae]
MRFPQLALALSLMFPLSLAAADWRQLQLQASQALQDGRLDEALELARQALDEAQHSHGKESAHSASSLNDLALIESERGNHTQALELIGGAVAIATKALGPEHDNTLALLLNQGLLAQAAGNHPQAMDALQRYLDIQRHRKDADAPSRLKALGALGHSYLASGQYPAAERSARQALAILAGQEPPDPLWQAASLDDLAQALLRQDRRQAAIEALQQALALRREALGDDGEVATSLERLARQYEAQGRHEETLSLRRQALAILEKHAPDSLDIAQHLNELAMQHYRREEYAQAAPLFQRSLAIVQRQKGENSIEAAILIASLGRLKQSQGDEKGAWELFERSLAIHRDNPSQPLYRAQALSDRGLLNYRKRRLREAEADFLEAQALLEDLYGHDSPELLPILNNLLVLYQNQRQSAKAAPYARRIRELGKHERSGLPGTVSTAA